MIKLKVQLAEKRRGGRRGRKGEEGSLKTRRGEIERREKEENEGRIKRKMSHPG